MSLHTPHCGCTAHAALERHSLAPGLDALACPACGRVLLRQDDYRLWRKRQPAGAPIAASDAEAGEDGRQARACPGCGRLMARPRSGTTPDFRLDHCEPCQLLWLDAGEWQRLVAAGLALQLDTVLGERWQQQLREAEARRRREADLRQRFGADTMDEVVRIRAWLAAQPHRRELLALIGSADQQGL